MVIKLRVGGGQGMITELLGALTLQDKERIVGRKRMEIWLEFGQGG
jgi:hypothetical protein